jgi:hypothetical protein
VTSSQATMFRGARVSRMKAGSNPAPSGGGFKHEGATASTLRASAYVLARANQHKPWARRWLKQRGEWA